MWDFFGIYHVTHFVTLLCVLGSCHSCFLFCSLRFVELNSARNLLLLFFPLRRMLHTLISYWWSANILILGIFIMFWASCEYYDIDLQTSFHFTVPNVHIPLNELKWKICLSECTDHIAFLVCGMTFSLMRIHLFTFLPFHSHSYTFLLCASVTRR